MLSHAEDGRVLNEAVLIAPSYRSGSGGGVQSCMIFRSGSLIGRFCVCWLIERRKGLQRISET